MTEQEKICLVADKLAGKGKNIIFTGAGISTESGIPDYRSKGGIWDKFRPVMFDEFMSSRAAREEYWRRKGELWQDLSAAEPNSAHLAVVRLYELGCLEAVITQNIDGLHQLAGLPDDRVIELHGSNRRVRCLSCSRLVPPQDVYRRLREGDPAPECDCGGYLKPDTVSFGQSLPAAKLKRACQLSKSCGTFTVIGSTLLVQPAAYLPVQAKENGAFLSIINLSETPCDETCDVLIRAKAGEVLPRIVRLAGIKAGDAE